MAKMTKPPRWTPEEEATLLDMVEAHRPYPEMAIILGRTEKGIRARCERLRVALTTTNGRSMEKTAALLGVEGKTMALWIREGWLRAYDTTLYLRHGSIKVIEHEDLLAFLEEEGYWHLWEPASIRDQELRDWCTESRRGLRFYTTAEAGEILCLTHYGVNQLIREKRIKAVKRGYNWLVRSDWLHYTLQSPSRGRTATEDERRFIRAWYGKRPATWVAAKLKRSDTFVLRMAKELGMVAVGRGHWKKPQEKVG